MIGRCLAVALMAALTACAQETGKLSLEKGRSCAADAFGDHGGSFRLSEDRIAYSYESANGPAKVIVVFDKARRPIRTFFESAPYGSHQELMDAARAIKECVAYGPKSTTGATSMSGK